MAINHVLRKCRASWGFGTPLAATICVVHGFVGYVATNAVSIAKVIATTLPRWSWSWWWCRSNVCGDARHASTLSLLLLFRTTFLEVASCLIVAIKYVVCEGTAAFSL